MPANAGETRDIVSISGLGRSSREGNTPVFLPGESLDRGAWRATVLWVAKKWTQLKHLAYFTRLEPSARATQLE